MTAPNGGKIKKRLKTEYNYEKNPRGDCHGVDFIFNRLNFVKTKNVGGVNVQDYAKICKRIQRGHFLSANVTRNLGVRNA